MLRRPYQTPMMELFREKISRLSVDNYFCENASPVVSPIQDGGDIKAPHQFFPYKFLNRKNYP